MLMFLDAIAPTDSPIKLFFYQRIALRACIRYRYHSFTATRATSKSFIAMLSLILRAIFLPGSKLFTCADVKGTAIKITRQKIEEIFTFWPLLRNEVASIKESTDYIELTFKNGSIFSIVSMSSAGRGTRSTAGINYAPLRRNTYWITWWSPWWGRSRKRLTTKAPKRQRRAMPPHINAAERVETIRKE